MRFLAAFAYSHKQIHHVCVNVATRHGYKTSKNEQVLIWGVSAQSKTSRDPSLAWMGACSIIEFDYWLVFSSAISFTRLKKKNKKKTFNKRARGWKLKPDPLLWRMRDRVLFHPDRNRHAAEKRTAESIKAIITAPLSGPALTFSVWAPPAFLIQFNNLEPYFEKV